MHVSRSEDPSSHCGCKAGGLNTWEHRTPSVGMQIDNFRLQNNIISISINFVSEQMLNNDEGKIIKNKDTWTFEKPVSSSSPIWILTQT